MKNKSVVLGIFCLAFGNCSDTEEPIPSYIALDQYQVSVLPNQGTALHQFKDVWLFANDQYVGAYELPVRIPILQDSDFVLKVIPGIRKNGVLSEPVRFTFMDPFEQMVAPNPGQIIQVSPVYQYASDIQFPFIEDFDRFHFFNDDRDNNPETAIVLSAPEEAFEGSHSGLIALTAQNPYLYVWYDLQKIIPVTPNRVFLELHYKSEIPFYIGFVGIKANEFDDLLHGTVLPSKDWRKIYFDFTDITNDAKSDFYKLALAANYIADSSKTEQKIWLDNIKVTTR
ncbi:MAG: hypothetical protein IPM48_09010 [Saprospiraceae bacterium]|nr:hypothetical protein [Saprospiraceae bacterium]